MAALNKEYDFVNDGKGVEEQEAVLKALPVRQLKSILDQRLVNHSDCVEKSDLVKKVLSKELNKTLARPNSTFGDLTGFFYLCSLSPKYLLVVSHGYGAGAGDLDPIAQQFARGPLKGKDFLIFVPAAPLSLPQGGRGWWPLDIPTLMRRAMGGELDQLMSETPDGLNEATAKLSGSVTAICTKYAIEMKHVVLAGFSQGATVSVDTALSMSPPPGGLVAWTPVAARVLEWKNAIAERKSLRVFHSQGSQDPVVIPLMGQTIDTKAFGEHPQELLETFSFAGGHTIPPEGMEALKTMLAKISEE